MVKRMCAGHGDSFTYTTAELGPTLLVFLAFENIFFFFFKQNLSDSWFGLCVSCTVFNLLSHCTLWWMLFSLRSAGFCFSLLLSAMLWSRLVISILIYCIVLCSIAKKEKKRKNAPPTISYIQCRNSASTPADMPNCLAVCPAEPVFETEWWIFRFCVSLLFALLFCICSNLSCSCLFPHFIPSNLHALLFSATAISYSYSILF